MEIWKPIPGYKGAYEASSNGQIRSIDRPMRIKGGFFRPIKGKILKCADLGRGYLYVRPTIEGLGKQVAVHRLVAMTFIQEDISGLTVNHKNGNKSDNRVANLEVVTHAENIRHACTNGLRDNRGESNTKAKLKSIDIPKIRRLIVDGVSSAEIAKIFNIGILAIQRIKSGVRWSHIK